MEVRRGGFDNDLETTLRFAWLSGAVTWPRLVTRETLDVVLQMKSIQLAPFRALSVIVMPVVSASPRDSAGAGEFKNGRVDYLKVT